MNTHDQDRIKKLLQQTFPPVDGEPGRDLWPDVLERMDARPVSIPWFDWALLGGLAGLILFFPATIPMLLYYL